VSILFYCNPPSAFPIAPLETSTHHSRNPSLCMIRPAYDYKWLSEEHPAS
jgi:hypothetical protein